MEEKIVNNENVEEVSCDCGDNCECGDCGDLEDYECVSAGFFSRLFSKVIDWILFAVMAGLALVSWNFFNGNVLNAVATKLSANQAENEAVMASLDKYNTFAQGSIMALIIFALVLFVYYFVFGASDSGSTIGERAFGIEVIDEDCFLLSKGKVAIRSLIRVVVELLPLAYIMIPKLSFNLTVLIATFIPMIVVYVFAAFSADKQGLHDMAVGAYALND